jgi:hypothetical protein
MNSTPSPKTKQRQPKVRRCRLATTHAGSVALTIRQQEGKQAPQTDVYYLEPIVSEMGGRGLILHKHDCTSYCVRLDGKDSECDCKGFTRYSHCKHVEALAALQAAGKL